MYIVCHFRNHDKVCPIWSMDYCNDMVKIILKQKVHICDRNWRFYCFPYVYDIVINEFVYSRGNIGQNPIILL